VKISTKGRYGIRAMVDIGANANNGQVPLCKVSKRLNVSENYLEHVFSILRKAKLVKSIKGAQGGYILNESKHPITVSDILKALEGEISVVESNDLDSEKYEKVIKELIWNKIDDAINKTIESIKLDDLIEEYKFNNNYEAFVYNI
jgi:Rrf2 family protein